MPKKYFLLLIVFFMLVFGLASSFAQESAGNDCAAVRYLMANNISPYDMDLGGGRIGDNIPVAGTMPANHYADFWSFTVTRPTANSGAKTAIEATIQFENAGAGLEFALFRGMIPEIAFAPLANTAFGFNRDATYTLVVRRTNLLDTSDLSYTLSLATESRGQINPPESIDLSNALGQGASPAAQYAGGNLAIQMPLANVLAHANAINLLNTQGGRSSQVYFPDTAESNPAAFTLHLGDWAQDMRFLAGDMAIRGRNRFYYLENFAYAGRLDGTVAGELDLLDISYPDLSRIMVDWEIVAGVWVLNDCAGFKLTDGRSFLGEIAALRRSVEFTGNLDAFMVEFKAPSNTVQAQFNWAEIQAEGQITYQNGIFDFPLTVNRQLSLQSNNLLLNSASQTAVTLVDTGVSLNLDWHSMQSFSLRGDLIRINFTDAARANANFERSAVNLLSFEALDDVIRIKYRPDGLLAGEERLILSEAEGFIEILSPQGLPTVNGQALPDQAGYVPRALNNTGAECYPVNTILPEANCPANGEINPANGNLFYAVQDMASYGSSLNLDLSRSYNSRLAQLDGAFGRGWTSPYRLDYQTDFSLETASRLITPNDRVGLDLTWASRGLVTFISPTGSQHQFVSQTANYEGGLLRAVTMPNWTLYRESALSPTWTLNQVDGLSYIFDRAGRLLSYSNGGQSITITYPRNSLTSANAATENVLIRDTAGRQLALRYDDNGHIVEALLTSADAREELRTSYQYSADLLTGVTYADGTEARYRYDEAGRLIEALDPRAPIHSHLRYEYDAEGNVSAIYLINASGEALPYRFYSVTLNANTIERRAVLMNELNNRREYVYRYSAAELRTPADTFSLVRISNPLSEVDERENRAMRYQYENGLLVRVFGDLLSETQGRAGTSYEYNQFGQITCIACLNNSHGTASLEIIYEPNPTAPETAARPTEIRYANGTSERFTYDENGNIASYTDTYDAVYVYEWNSGFLQTSTRQQDGEQIAYTYNSSGQVLSENRTLGGNRYQLSYEYDWLGRLLSIADSAVGTYRIAYQNTANGIEITVTDPLGTNSSYLYDTRQRLIETAVTADALLALNTYIYDIYNNLTEETAWLIDATTGIPISTRYQHERQATIPPLTATDAITVINGTEITVTRPGRGSEAYSFDALGRIRRVEDPFQRSYYDYVLSSTGSYRNGLNIRQRSLNGDNAQASITDYLFDARYQLREVRTARQQWEIGLDGENSIRQSSLRVLTDGLVTGFQSALWSNYSHGVPTVTDIRNGELPLLSGFNLLNNYRPANTLALDFAGRPLAISDGNGATLAIAYCSTPNAYIQVRYSKQAAVNCETAAYEVAISYDGSGRIVAYQDSFGSRTFTYSAQTDSHTWDLTIEFTAAENPSFTWQLRYDALGQLLRWLDADGFEHLYTYDTLGRLTTVTILNQPENSFSFRYNEANLLLEESNGLGAGYLYEYNEFGQVLRRLDKSTGASSSYAYNPQGQIERIIGFDGGITSYLYEDSLNSERLTAVIEPSGERHNFTWNDRNNTLIYTDPLQNVTSYYFDGNGLLWRVDDPLTVAANSPRSTEFIYNDAGELASLSLDLRENRTNQANYNLERTGANALTIHEDTSNWSANLAFAASGELLEADGVEFAYDALARLQSISYNENAWTLSRSDGSPVLILLDGYGTASELHYDSLYRLVEELSDSNRLSIAYEDKSISVTLPDGSVNQYQFSYGDIASGSPATVTRLGNGLRVLYLYNNSGLLTEIRTELCTNSADSDINTCPRSSRSIHFQYDAVGRPIAVLDADGRFESFSYDEIGRLASYQSKDGARFNYNYDAAGRLMALTSPSGIQLLLQRNSLDRVTGICRSRLGIATNYAACIQAGGLIETYAYDALGRMTERSYNAGQSTLSYHYSFESTGALSTSSSPDFTTSFNYNELGRLTGIETETNELSFAYDGLGRILGVDALTYSYDLSNRLVEAGNLTYAATPQLFSISDSQNAFIMNYALNNRGLVTSINGATLSIDYPNATSINITRSDGVLLQQNLNQAGIVQGVNYAGELNISRQFDAAGYMVQAVLNMPQTGLGYSISLAYDSDKRPVTMHINNLANLQSIYSQSFVYNEAGLLRQENREYAESKIQIDYEYSNQNQLARQIIQISAAATNFSAGFIFTFGLLGTLSLPTRLRSKLALRFGLVVTLLLFGLQSIPALVAQEATTFILDYSYDSRGRLESIVQSTPNADSRRIECARFDYDGLDRLARVRLNHPSTGETQISYRYDEFNRLIAAGDYRLSYEQNRLFALSDGTNTQYFGGLPEQAPQFSIDQNQQITWLYNDGGQRIVAAVPDGSDLTSVWLFDPLNRYIALTDPQEFFSNCQLSGLPNSLSIQPYGDGTIWDSRSNLYFKDGRAYDPRQAGSLQANSQGPDALGYLYANYGAQAAIPFLSPAPAYRLGLDILHEAETAIALNAQLEAAAIRATYGLTAPDYSHPIANSLAQTQATFNRSVQTIANLPLWLQSQYNLPAPSRDPQTGAISLASDSHLAMGGSGQSFSPYPSNQLPAWTDYLNANVVQGLPELSVHNPAFRSYLPWTMNNVSYADIHQRPTLPIYQQANAVWDWLPQTLAAPSQALPLLDFAESLSTMPTMPHYLWIEQQLALARPQEAELPPETAAAWLENWFSNDIFGLEASQALPSLPSLPAAPNLGQSLPR